MQIADCVVFPGVSLDHFQFIAQVKSVGFVFTLALLVIDVLNKGNSGTGHLISTKQVKFQLCRYVQRQLGKTCGKL